METLKVIFYPFWDEATGVSLETFGLPQLKDLSSRSGFEEPWPSSMHDLQAREIQAQMLSITDHISGLELSCSGG